MAAANSFAALLDDAPEPRQQQKKQRQQKQDQWPRVVLEEEYAEAKYAQRIDWRWVTQHQWMDADQWRLVKTKRAAFRPKQAVLQLAVDVHTFVLQEPEAPVYAARAGAKRRELWPLDELTAFLMALAEKRSSHDNPYASQAVAYVLRSLFEQDVLKRGDVSEKPLHA